MTEEKWANIEGHKNHFVSNLGNVKSIDHVVLDKGRPSHRKGRVFSLSAGGNGYIRVVIERKWYAVHRLVAEAFIPKPEGYNVVNHKNGIKTDNRAANLEWTTVSGNGIHAHKTGLNRLTEEGRKRIQDSQRGRKMSEEHKAKLCNSHAVGYKHSEETKKRISESITNWHKTRKQ